jgi:hypothetical protein
MTALATISVLDNQTKEAIATPIPLHEADTYISMREQFKCFGSQLYIEVKKITQRGNMITCYTGQVSKSPLSLEECRFPALTALDKALLLLDHVFGDEAPDEDIEDMYGNKFNLAEGYSSLRIASLTEDKTELKAS